MSPEFTKTLQEPLQVIDMFDELAGLLAENSAPDKSEAFFDSMRAVFNNAEAMQDIQRLSEMAMTLGAMACLHPHLENFANEMGEKYGQKYRENDGHDHKSDKSDEPRHDSKKCTNCKNGKHCSHSNNSRGVRIVNK